MKRLTACVLALLALCFALTGCSERGRKNAASRIINQNIVEITRTANEVLETGEVPEGADFSGVERISYAAPDWVGFQTGGREQSGDDAGEAYCGFYYSPDDEPLGFQGEDMDLVPDTGTDGVWTWQGEDNSGSGGGSYYTARIQQCWFYYEIYL